MRACVAASGDRYAQLYLIVADPDGAGPGVLRLAELLREEVVGGCKGQRTAELLTTKGTKIT